MDSVGNHLQHKDNVTFSIGTWLDATYCMHFFFCEFNKSFFNW